MTTPATSRRGSAGGRDVVPANQRRQWNEDENDALLSVPWRARVVYLQGLRWNMDFDTGMVGGAQGHGMSYQKLSEVLDCTDGQSTKPDPRVSKEGLRAIFRMLERAGLIEWVKHDGKGLIFRCLLADTNQSDQNKDNPKATPRQPQASNPNKTNSDSDLGGDGNPKTTPCCTREDNPPQESVIREEGEAKASVDLSAVGADEPASANLPTRQVFEHWRKRSQHTRAKLDAKRRRAIAARLKDGYSIDDLQRAIDGCMSSPWHQGQNSNHRRYDDIELICRNASKVDQFIAIANQHNQEQAKLDAWMGSDDYIDGECSHVR